MGCANEKECKKQVQTHTCGIFDINQEGSNSHAKQRVEKKATNQYIKDIENHYRDGSMQSELGDDSLVFYYKQTGNIFLEKRPQSQKIETYDQGLHIGQYLQMEGEIDEIELRRTKSFNPDQKWKKMDDEYKQQYCQEEYTQKQDQLKKEFLEQYLQGCFDKNKKEFNEKLRQGPKQEYRWQSWKTKLLNEQDFQEFFRFKVKNIYEFMLCPFMIKNQDSFYEENMYLIVKDITRTFPERKYFEEMGQEQLKRTLLATSNLFRKVGYCQGMNFIMGMLLIVSGADESSVFDCFISLSFRPEYMLVGLFETGFPLLRFLEYAFDFIFKNRLPKLHLHFNQQEILNTAWITKWLMTLYLYSFPLNKCIRIMDYMISSNVFALIYVAVQILVALEQELLKMDGTQIITFFQRRISVSDSNTEDTANIPTLDSIDIQEVIQNAPKLALSNKQIRKLARECKESIAEEYFQLISKVNQKEKDYELFINNYAIEVSNITLFIHYYTLEGKTEQQAKYLELIKYKYINIDLIEKEKPNKQKEDLTI